MTSPTPPAEPLRLDVRPLLAQGVEPFDAIMQAAARVEVGGALELTAPFEPVPLYAALGARGFEHGTERRSEGEWVVTFRRVRG